MKGNPGKESSYARTGNTDYLGVAPLRPCAHRKCRRAAAVLVTLDYGLPETRTFALCPRHAEAQQYNDPRITGASTTKRPLIP